MGTWRVDEPPVSFDDVSCTRATDKAILVNIDNDH